MGPHAFDLKALVTGVLRQRYRLLRGQADPMHACVHLDVDPGRAAQGPAGLHQRLQTALRVQRRRQRGRQRVLLRPRWELGQDQDGGLDPRLPEPDPLLHQRHPQPRRTGLQRGPGHGDVAMAVPVGLDHGHELRVRRPEGPDVVPHRPEVDVGDGGAEPHAPSRTDRIAPGSARATSRAVAPSPAASPAASAARPCTYAAAVAASAGPRPRATKAGMAPARTSPVPPVERTEDPVGLIRTSPPGLATRVRGPLRRTAALVSSAALRTKPTRSSRTSSASMPNSRPNSPVCGVTTRSEARAARSPPRRGRAFRASASATTGTGHSARSRRTNAGVVSSVESPGPMATVSKPSIRPARASQAPSAIEPPGPS